MSCGGVRSCPIVAAPLSAMASPRDISIFPSAAALAGARESQPISGSLSASPRIEHIQPLAPLPLPLPSLSQPPSSLSELLGDDVDAKIASLGSNVNGHSSS